MKGLYGENELKSDNVKVSLPHSVSEVKLFGYNLLAHFSILLHRTDSTIRWFIMVSLHSLHLSLLMCLFVYRICVDVWSLSLPFVRDRRCITWVSEVVHVWVKPNTVPVWHTEWEELAGHEPAKVSELESAVWELTPGHFLVGSCKTLINGSI